MSEDLTGFVDQKSEDFVPVFNFPTTLHFIDRPESGSNQRKVNDNHKHTQSKYRLKNYIKWSSNIKRGTCLFEVLLCLFKIGDTSSVSRIFPFKIGQTFIDTLSPFSL